MPGNKKTHLSLKVSHHQHGDWQLIVKANGETIADELISSKTVNKEWFETKVDLSNYAGKTIDLIINNHPNNWHNEWAYWNEVKIISE